MSTPLILRSLIFYHDGIRPTVKTNNCLLNSGVLYGDYVFLLMDINIVYTLTMPTLSSPKIDNLVF